VSNRPNKCVSKTGKRYLHDMLGLEEEYIDGVERDEGYL